ncbi:pilin [Patescibacteria group bacterium]
MAKPKKKFIQGLLLGLITTLFVVIPLVTTAQDSPPIDLKLSVPIPGFGDQGAIRVDSSTLGQYIQNLYIWFVGIAGILAAVLIMWGGVKWITAAGNESLITSAKTTINGAVLGIIILLTSYLLLTWISPNLINLRLPGISEISTKIIGLEYCDQLDDRIKARTRANNNTSDFICGHEPYEIYDENNNPLGSTCIGRDCPGQPKKTCGLVDLDEGQFDCVDPDDACKKINDLKPRSQADCDAAQDVSEANLVGIPKNICRFKKDECKYLRVLSSCGHPDYKWVSCGECLQSGIDTLKTDNDHAGSIKAELCSPINNDDMRKNLGRCIEPQKYTGAVKVDGLCCKALQPVTHWNVPETVPAGGYICRIGDIDIPLPFP